MLKIRLQRLGRKKRPIYRLVVAEHSAPVKGRYVDTLGHYDPLMKEGGFTIDQDKLKAWVAKGAKPTNTVARLCVGVGIDEMKRFVIEMKDRKKKKAGEEEASASPEAPADKPAEDTKEKAPASEKKPEETQENPPVEKVKQEAEQEPKTKSESAPEQNTDTNDDSSSEESDSAQSAKDNPPEEESKTEEGSKDEPTEEEKKEAGSDESAEDKVA